MYWGKQRFIQVLIFDKFWYCFLIMGLEYLRLKILLFNFYSNWKGKNKLSWHCIFWRFIYHYGETNAFLEKKSNFWGAPSQQNIIECTWHFTWGTHLYMSLFLSVRSSIRPSVRLSVCPSVRHAPYFRNGTSYDIYFWYTCVNWWYIQLFFSFF